MRQACSTGGINIITAFLALLSVASNINFNAATSRQLWAFARDGGVPFGGWLSHVNECLQLPIRALRLTYMVTCLLACLDLRQLYSLTEGHRRIRYYFQRDNLHIPDCANDYQFRVHWSAALSTRLSCRHITAIKVSTREEDWDRRKRECDDTISFHFLLDVLAGDECSRRSRLRLGMCSVRWCLGCSIVRLLCGRARYLCGASTQTTF